MKKQSMTIICYSVLNLIGGLIGYVVAGSVMSLLASSIVACILLICALFMRNGNRGARLGAMAVICMLTLFFSYRYFITQKIVPSAIMSVVSGCLFIYLARTQPADKAISHKA